MPTAENAIGSLNIHRHNSVYRIASDHPSPDALRSKLDNIAQREFGAAIASALSQALSDSTDSSAGIWLIRSITLDVDLNLDAPADQLGRIWAREAVASIARVLQEDAETEQVLHFSSAAAYLAHFLRDLVDGSASEKWYYRRFDGLRSLPLSAAVRDAVCRDSATGFEALQQMSDSNLRRVLGALDEHDAKWTLNEVASKHSPERPLNIEQIDPRSAGQVTLDGENRAALQLYLKLCKKHPEAAGIQLRNLVGAFVCLSRCLREMPSRQSKLLAAIAEGDAVDLFQSVNSSDAERLLPLLEYPREWLQNLAQSAQAPASPSTANDEPRHTAAGGIFFLLPLLDAMPIAEATQDWPSLHDCPATSLVRWIVLMKCFGKSGAGYVFHDPLIRDLLGIPPQINAGSMKAWQQALTRKQLLNLQNRIALWQFENSIETQNSISAFVAGRHPRSLLCCDRSGSSLLLALPDSPSSREDLRSALSAWPAMSGPVRSSENDKNQLAGASLPEAELESLLRDLDFLRLPTAIRGSQRSELAFNVAARALLRNFSGRLMGFAQSGLEYLFNNFLDVHASLLTDSTRSAVRLGQPPLHVVLSLTGMNRQSYSLNWRPETFELFPD